MNTPLANFKAQHARAFAKLAEYARDDEISAERINPILNARMNQNLPNTFRVEYLCPKAIARYLRRGGTNLEQFVRDNSTLSGVKHLPRYATAAEAQAVADGLNAQGTGAFAGLTYYRVVERESVAPSAAKPIDFARIERELQECYETDREYLGVEAAEEADAFSRRVLGMD